MTSHSYVSVVGLGKKRWETKKNYNDGQNSNENTMKLISIPESHVS